MKTIYETLRVLDLADRNASFVGKQLAAFGAEVLKIEKPEGDDERRRGSFAGGTADPEKSIPFAYNNTGKRSVTLRLETTEGQEIFRRLAWTADVIIETFEPGYMKKLGLDYDMLRKENPGLIMCSVTPFGQDGPHAHWKASSDLITDAMGGPMMDRGRVGQAPLHYGYDVMSAGASMYALFAIQAEYHSRLSTGEGAYIDISQQECFATWKDQFIGEAQVNDCSLVRVGGPDYALPFIHTCDQGLVFASVATKWQQLMDWFEEEGLDISVFDDPFYEEYAREIQTPINSVLMSYFDKLGEKYGKIAFMEEAQRRGFPMAAVEQAHTLIDNPHLKARKYFVEVDHPVMGAYQYPGAMAKMSESEQILDVPAPLLGADTDMVLTELGYTEEAIAALRSESVI
ncbi:MAG: CoA transferase [Clostridiales bacterium]|nr:CoA transferase [Clostridiales bacterium]